MMHQIEPLRILHIDSCAADAARTADLLREGNPSWVLETAGNLEAAAQRLGGVDYDLVLLDPALPDVGGVAAFRRLRALAPTSKRSMSWKTCSPRSPAATHPPGASMRCIT
jgi:CheY-like chemotaxis protein